MARRIGGGVQRRHLQQTVHAGVFRRLQHAAGEFGVGATEAVAAEAALVQDADEIDHHFLAAKPLGELRLVVDVAILQRQAGQHQQVLVEFAVARQHCDAVAGVDQPRDEARADETGAPKDAD